MTPTTDPHLDPHGWAAPVDWRWMLALGIVMLLGGVLAFLNPFIASLTVEAIAGATFLVAGAVQAWMAFSDDGQDRNARLLNGMLGAALIVLAVLLLANPLAGLVTLTLAVATLFLAFGILRSVIAFRLRPHAAWGWMLASGLMSAALALLIFLTLPEAALGLLGLFLGVDLVMSGAMSLGIALGARKG